MDGIERRDFDFLSFQLTGATLLPGMTKVLKEMADDDHLCSLALVAIGKIGHRLPHLVHADLALIQSSFDSLATATGERLSALQVRIWKRFDLGQTFAIEGIMTSVSALRRIVF